MRDGRILEVGTRETLQLWRENDAYRIGDDFADCVIMPGLIDPHLRPLMAAVLLPMQFITAMRWKFPWKGVPATTTSDRYLAELHRHQQETPGTEAFFTWGYHRHWHGEVTRAVLDEIFADRPAVVWQRSFREVYLNTAMMAHIGIDESDASGRHQIDYERGHSYENGLGYAISKLNPTIMSPEWLDSGLDRLRRLTHFGGHTTVGDLAVGIFDVSLEWEAAQRVLKNPAPALPRGI